MFMRIIDRYLLRQFLEVYFITFCSLTGLYVVLDAFNHLDEFLGWVDTTKELLVVMGEFYLYRTIGNFEKISALLTLIAAMFTLTWIQRYHELTAISAAGIASGRVVRPILAACVVMSLVAAASREFAIPLIKLELAKDPKDLKGEAAQELQPVYDQRTDILLQGAASFAKDKRIKEPNFILPASLAGRTVSIVAESAFYQPPQKLPAGDREGGYLLTGVSQPPDFCKRHTLFQKGRPVVILPSDAPWLKPDECFVASDVSFPELVSGERLRKFASTKELIAGLQNRSLDYGAETRVTIHARLVQPLLDLVLVFLGLPFVLGSERRNVFVSIAVCMAVTSLFMVVVLGCHWLGTVSLITPALAAWLPLMLFAPVASWLAEPIFR